MMPGVYSARTGPKCLESAPGGLGRPDDDIDGLDEVLFRLLVQVEGIERGTAELVGAAEEDAQGIRDLGLRAESSHVRETAFGHGPQGAPWYEEAQHVGRWAERERRSRGYTLLRGVAWWGGRGRQEEERA